MYVPLFLRAPLSRRAFASRRAALSCRTALAALAAAALSACGGGGMSAGGGGGGSQCGGYLQPPCSGGGGFGGAGGGQYIANGLVSDTGSGTLHTDANLVNGWGLAFNPSGYAWVADNVTGVSTLYDGNGVQQPPVVTLPAGVAGAAMPTGEVYNSTGGFAFTANAISGTPLFIWATLEGTIAAWSPTVDATHAFNLVDLGATGAIYTGLATGTDTAGDARLWAANFAQGRVDTFDTTFTEVTVAGAFADPGLPASYSPFGIQQIGNRVYVAYAQVDPVTGLDVHAAGAGALDVFDADGTLLTRLVAPGGALDAPWGIALAPADFGPQSNQLLVGNFGDGTIHAFDPSVGTLEGQILNNDGSAIVLDGLWGIAFGNGLFNQPANTLFYAAGPAGELQGRYGRIDLN